MGNRWKVTNALARARDNDTYARAEEFLTRYDGSIGESRELGYAKTMRAMKDKDGRFVYAVQHHSTILVAYLPDELVYVRPYNSVTSKRVISHYSPANLSTIAHSITCKDIPSADGSYPAKTDPGNELQPYGGVCRSCIDNGTGEHVLISKGSFVHYPPKAWGTWNHDSATGTSTHIPNPSIAHTRPKVWRCRSCSGSGKRTERRYTDRSGKETSYRGGWGTSRKVSRYVTRFEDMCEGCAELCDPANCNAGWVRIPGTTTSEYHGERYISYGEYARDENLTPSHHSHGTGVFRSHPCSDCSGSGTRDYGSKPIPYIARPMILTRDGEFVRYATSEPFTAYREPVKPKKPRKAKNVTGEIIGYRAWGYDDNGNILPLGIRSAGVYPSFDLPPAKCENGCTESIPNEGCGCGYWLVNESFLGSVIANYRAQVWGKVRAWGKVVRHTHGYRAERLIIDYLATSSARLGELLRENYPHIPVHVIPFPADDTAGSLDRAIELASCVTSSTSSTD